MYALCPYSSPNAHFCCEYPVDMYCLNWASKLLTSDTKAKNGLFTKVSGSDDGACRMSEAYKRARRLLSVDIDDELKAGQAVEPFRGTHC